MTANKARGGGYRTQIIDTLLTRYAILRANQTICCFFPGEEKFQKGMIHERMQKSYYSGNIYHQLSPCCLQLGTGGPVYIYHWS